MNKNSDDQLKNQPVATLIKSLQIKVYQRRENDSLSNFTIGQIVEELNKKQQDIIFTEDEQKQFKEVVGFLSAQRELVEKRRDEFHTREMTATQLLKELLKNVGKDFYREIYIEELEIRQGEGLLTNDEQNAFSQLKDVIVERRKEAVEQIKKAMGVFVEEHKKRLN